MVSPGEWFADCPDRELRRLLELHRPKGNRVGIEAVVEKAWEVFTDPRKQGKTIDSLLARCWQLEITTTPEQENGHTAGQWVQRTVLLPNQLDQALLFHSFFQVPRSREEVEARLIADQLIALGVKGIDIESWLASEPTSTQVVDQSGMQFEERPGCRPAVLTIPKALDDVVETYAQTIGVRPGQLIRACFNQGLAQHSIVSEWNGTPLPNLQLVFPPQRGSEFRIFRETTQVGDSFDIARLVIRGEDAAVALTDDEPGLADCVTEILWLLKDRLRAQPTPDSVSVNLNLLPLPSGARIEPLEAEPFIDVLEELGQHAAFIGGDRWRGGHGCDVHVVIDPHSPLLRDLHVHQERNAREVIGLTVSSNAAPELLQTLAQALAGVVWRTPLLCNPPEPLDITGGDAVGAVVGVLVGLGFEAVISYVPWDDDQVDPGSVEVRRTSGYASIDHVVISVLERVCQAELNDDLGELE